MKYVLMTILAPVALIRLLVAFSYTFICYIAVVLADAFNKKKPEKFLWYMLRFWARGMLIILGVKTHVTRHTEIDMPGLILSNHRSYIDIFINMALNPAYIIAKKEIANWPMFGHGFKIYDMLLIDRGNYRSRVQNMKKVEKVLVEGNSLILYPEGTTHRGPEIGSMKDSTFGIAANNNIRVYPVAIEYKNPDDAWVGSDLFVPHFLRRSGSLVRHVGVVMGAPVKDNDKTKLKEKVRGFMEREISQMRQAFDQ